MKNIFAGIPEDILKKRKKVRQPSFIPPMLATLTDEYFSSKDWLYEQKFDGERCLTFKHNGHVTLISRTDKAMNEEYPELATALSKQIADNFIIDGEIAALSKGISRFELLQARINVRDIEKIKAREKRIPIVYYIFDVLYADGYDVSRLPLDARKEILQRLLNYNETLRDTQFILGDGLTFFKKACKLGWEGIIAKRIASEYVSVRSRDWLKFKCIMKQEFVISGYTDPQGSRTDFGALLVGYYQNGTLRYAGKVGTGFTHETLTMLGRKLRALEIKTCPFSDYDESTNGVHWAKPKLVAEIQFAEWTKAGRLRVPRYKGLRNDKEAQDVVKEVPVAIVPPSKKP